MDFQNPGTQDNWLGEGGQFKPMDNGYPGGAFFDPFGLSRGGEKQLRKYQVMSPFPMAVCWPVQASPRCITPQPAGAGCHCFDPFGLSCGGEAWLPEEPGESHC